MSVLIFSFFDSGQDGLRCDARPLGRRGTCAFGLRTLQVNLAKQEYVVLEDVEEAFGAAGGAAFLEEMETSARVIFTPTVGFCLGVLC